jgi:hypothetical protein
MNVNLSETILYVEKRWPGGGGGEAQRPFCMLINEPKKTSSRSVVKTLLVTTICLKIMKIVILKATFRLVF